MQYANTINASFFDRDGIVRMVSADEYRTIAAPQKEALTFILNFFEFVAVGIRCGDLDERIVRNTHRGLIINMVTVSDSVIRLSRRDDGIKIGKPKCFRSEAHKSELQSLMR